jgi:pyruvate/2-oxoglutarate dehydrogenase complex dihydrolipoamide dehydrogenase (E3) component
VILAQRADRLLPREDPEISELIHAKLQAEGIRVILKARVQGVTQTAEGTRVEFASGLENGMTGARAPIPATVDAVLAASGRMPNIERLNLAAAGVASHEHGILVSQYLQTSVPRIFAAGDVAGPRLFTHTADAQARIVIRNTLFPWKLLWQKMDYRVVPSCTYTTPEVARVGINETEAAQQGIPFDLYQIPMRELDRAVLSSETDGLAKVLTEKGKDRILGATLVCEHAGDLIAEFALAMKHRLGLSALASTIHAYPTNAEIARKLGDRYNRTRLTPGAKKLFSWLYARGRKG